MIQPQHRQRHHEETRSGAEIGSAAHSEIEIKTAKLSIHTPKLGSNMTPTREQRCAENDTQRESNVRDASRHQRSKRGKNNRQAPQTRFFFAGDVLQLLTRLKAETMRTASYIKRQTLNFA